MTRLFLASTFSRVADLFAERVPKCRVLLIANPLDPYHEGYDGARADRRAFTSRGFKVLNWDLRELRAEELRDELVVHKTFRVLHVCGGSAVYTINLLRERGMDKVISEAVSKGLIYTGTSAGSMICAPDLALCKDDVDEIEAGQEGKLKDRRGLGLVGFYTVVHAQDKYYSESNRKLVDLLQKNRTPLLFLNDNMAAWCTGKKVEILVG